MGMFDTIRYECPFCGEETDCQTKLGEDGLDYWSVGDKTTIPDIEFVGRDGCHSCDKRATFTILDSRLVAVRKEPSNKAQQEVLWGNLKPLGTDPDKILNDVAEEFRKAFEEMEDE